MIYYIDGYNLLFRDGFCETSSLEDSRNQIISDFNDQIEALNLKIILVFDSHNEDHTVSRIRYKSLEIIYTSFNQTADEYMLEKVNLSKTPREIVVVSNDKKLGREILEYKAQYLSLEDFFSLIKKRKTPKKNEKKLENFDNKDFEYYNKEFLKRYKDLDS